jgi:hypothetical protein
MTPAKSIFLPLIGFLALQGTLSTVLLAGEAEPDAALDSSAALESEAALPTAIPSLSRNEAVTQALGDQKALELVIAQLETSQGAYGAELSEAYFQLGTTERTLELPEAAVETFGKALQSLKIGYGLYDLRQLPILEEMLTTYETLENWEEVDSIHHLIHFITARNPDADAELRFQSLVQLGRWKLQSEVDGLLPNREGSANEVLKLYENEIEKLEAYANYPDKSIHLATLYLDLAEVEFSEAKAKYAMPITEFGLVGQSSISTVSCVTFMGRDGKPVQSCTNVEVPNPSYYMEPSNKKNMEIRKHLDEMRDDVMQAYSALQNVTEGADQRVELLAEVQRLTREYNDFATMNSRSSLYRLD